MRLPSCKTLPDGRQFRRAISERISTKLLARGGARVTTQPIILHSDRLLDGSVDLGVVVGPKRRHRQRSASDPRAGGTRRLVGGATGAMSAAARILLTRGNAEPIRMVVEVPAASTGAHASHAAPPLRSAPHPKTHAYGGRKTPVPAGGETVGFASPDGGEAIVTLPDSAQPGDKLNVAVPCAYPNWRVRRAPRSQGRAFSMRAGC